MPDSGAPPPNLSDRVIRLEVQMEGVNKQLDQVATKSDIAILTRDINSVEVALKSDINTLNGKIEHLEVNLDGKIVNLEKRFDDMKSQMNSIIGIEIVQIVAFIALFVFLLMKL
ncbi:MAG: hypothetical protein LBQ79_07560 [Deltaproteobacteria bacterium]|jgi:predicted  nucleic acid-binding Zn-ribbon protein|nr:hypothetical protein [Deltaproteobacteria bacterium]